MRKLATALALIFAALAVADYLGWRTHHRQLLARAAASGLSDQQGDLAVLLRRETVASRAATTLAWRLLALEIDRHWLDDLPDAERRLEAERGLDRLRLARELAGEVLARQPASWRAAAVLGASRYLEAARRGQHDQPISAWREPLRAAMRLGPGYPEPPVLLASFYLSRWSTLSGAERDELPAVLARALQEPAGLDRLLPAWVRLAPSLGRLLEPIPDRPDAWQRLGREFLRLGDLERFAASHRRQIESLPGDLADRLERGRARLRGGHPKAGLSLLRPVLGAPPDLAYADTFSAALAALPEGPAGAQESRYLASWLQWARDLCAIDRCPLDEETMRRLSRSAEQELLEPPAEIARPAGLIWAGDGWRRRGEAYRIWLRTPAARALHLEIPDLPPAGGVVELRWDGRFLGVATLQPGVPLTWRLDVADGLHQIQVRHLTGRARRPGELTLRPAGAPG